jgi:hypothetical protein
VCAVPKLLTLLLAGLVGGILAVVGIAAVTPQLSTSAETAATADEQPAAPQVYGSR